MGYPCESAHPQHRPVRSDRNEHWSAEQHLQLLDLRPRQSSTLREPRTPVSQTTTATISHQPQHQPATSGSESAPRPSRTTTKHCPPGGQEATPAVDGTGRKVAGTAKKRRRSCSSPTLRKPSRSFLHPTTPTVLDSYASLVLNKLSQFIRHHVGPAREGSATNDAGVSPTLPTSLPGLITRETSPRPSKVVRQQREQTPNRLFRSRRTRNPAQCSAGLSAPKSDVEKVPETAPDFQTPRNDPRATSPSREEHLHVPAREHRNAEANAAFQPVAKPTSSHHLVRHSLCLYAASSVLLALCYLTIPTVASDTAHPIRGRVRFAEGKSDKEILDHLLKNSRYDKRLLPPVDDADFCCGMHTPEMAKHIPDMRVPGRPQNRGTLTVNVSVLLLSLASPDESSLKYEVEFLLQQQWFDPRLRYANQSQYEYLNAIHHHEDIWLPDTYFIMHGDFKDPIIPMHFALRIYRNGTINYLMRRHLILSCQGRLNIFPFDDPLCSFALESISYEQSAITYVWKNDEDTLRKSPSLTTLNAYLIQNQTIACPIKASWRAEGQTLSVEDEEFLCNLCQRRFEEQGNYSCLKVDLIFTRDRAFYFTTVFIPGIILVTSSFITFWLEWNAVPARSMIGVTTMLNFFTTSNGFRSTLPVVSNLTAMNVWDGVCMCFIYASLLEFVCVNYVGRKRPLHNVVYRPGENPVTQRLPAVLSRIGIILASPLETIDREFHTAIAAEKTTVATAASATTAAAAAAAASGRVAQVPSRGNLQPPPTAPVVATSGAPLGATAVGAAGASGPGGMRPAQSSVVMCEAGLEGPAEIGLTRRRPTVETKLNEIGLMETSFGVKKRESGGPNEIVACTSCAGGTSPCTHSANNGCATETCFVQVRKKEPPHPIRVAKTIDVIARITFPSAYAVFLIFFFIHYKGFS
ncbi:gamma-aminobutyric acid receptor subunit alpha-4 [Anopheles ziemanni]|uniref:gamma-aminobutyric acid receptor subunit alpha-4 n=1 Tax=Anopheles coustani TaxID=139045 RepID=UPI00265912DC|nr:gamma-aminobutyric acid receptor subunit alpha-4 [Anopheles coustani]XP_058177912.1 gamma-aminobutyric acid receptor subunit alpha-4 [Anopheles ziemanni]